MLVMLRLLTLSAQLGRFSGSEGVLNDNCWAESSSLPRLCMDADKSEDDAESKDWALAERRTPSSNNNPAQLSLC
ncbi:hypothetical protein D3C84_1029690 [compost metagenome]